MTCAMFRRFCKPNDLSGVHVPVDTRLPMARDILREHLDRHKQNKMHTIQDITSLVESFDRVLILDSDPKLLEARNIFVRVLQKMKQDELAKVQAAKLDESGIEKMYSQSPEYFAKLKRAKDTLYNALSRQGGVIMFYSVQDLKDIVRAFDELITLESSPGLLLERDVYIKQLESKELEVQAAKGNSPQDSNHSVKLKLARDTLHKALRRQGGVSMFYSLQDLKDIVRAFDVLIVLEPIPVPHDEGDMYASLLESSLVLQAERNRYVKQLESKELEYQKNGPSIFDLPDKPSENDPPEIKTFQEKVQTLYDGTFISNETKAMQETGMDYAARRGMYG
jgi:hypothetical protein